MKKKTILVLGCMGHLGFSISKYLSKKNLKVYGIYNKTLDKYKKKDLEKLSEKYLEDLKKNREFDAVFGGCKIGPHKSDIVGYNIKNNININQFSTGQQKTVILLIILAHCNFLINELKKNPIIFFDEVCSHLDLENRKLLLDLIETLNVQIFITGTGKNFFSFLSKNASYCNIKKNNE